MPHKPGNGAIFGILSEDGVAKTGFPVTLLDRTTGKPISRQYTDDNGGFVFNGLNTETDDYQVIGQDEDGETYKNAVIRDRIKPVPGYQGASYWGNWRYLANQIGIIASYEGQTGFNYTEDTLSGFIQDYPAMRSPIMRYSGNGSTGPVNKPTFDNSITPGDPSIPVTLFQNQTLTAYARTGTGTSGDYGYREGQAHTALELVADFSQLSSSTGWAGFTSTTNYDYKSRYEYEPNTSNNAINVIAAFYNISEQYLRIQINGKNTSNPWDSSYRYNVGDVDMSAYQGVHHVILSATYGDSMEVFIDGVLVTTLSMAGMSSTQYYATNGSRGYPGGVHVAGEYDGDSRPTSQCRGLTGPVALVTWYARKVTAEEAAALYQALMVGSQPLLTGYLKEVYAQRPSFLLRLNDSPDTTVFTNMMGVSGHEGTSYGQLEFLQPSIITGGNTIGFDGNSGIRFNYEGPQVFNPYGMAVMFVAQPEIETPAAYEELFKTTNTSESFDNGIIVRRTENGTIRFFVRAGGASEQVDFLTVMDHLALHHYIISVNKVEQLVTLYVDGVFVESVSVTSALIDRVSTGPGGSRRQVMVGGHVSDTSSISNGYSGLLGDIAVVQNPIPAEVAQELYDSRLVA